MIRQEFHQSPFNAPVRLDGGSYGAWQKWSSPALFPMITYGNTSEATYTSASTAFLNWQD